MSTFRLPDLGEGLAEAEILQWHEQPGDQVRVDQPMVSVETEKSVVEVPVPFNGTVTALHGAVGDIIETGAPLVDFDSGTVVGTMPEAPAEEFLVEPDVLPEALRDDGAARTRAIPAARALARHLEIDLGNLEGTGSGGLITLDDVLAAAPRGARSKSAPNADRPDGDRLDLSSLHDPDALPDAATLEPLRGPRRAMARSMTLSHAEVPLSNVCDDADIHAWRTRGDYMPRLMRALINAWRVEPALNAWYDPPSDSRILLGHIDLAIAVDTPQGLLVPVVRKIQDMSLTKLRAAVAERKTAAHQRTLAPEDFRGFTLMLSNFGTLAGRYGVPLVVPPAVAIIGAGKVRDEPVAAAGVVAVHRRMPLSLSFDHRCITGGEACRFLASVIGDLEQPD
jgi:pyruvate dehydrogenase E2 component (dihydrolipoamide acetyltransferase)